jgi:hypothetical protein
MIRHFRVLLGLAMAGALAVGCTAVASPSGSPAAAGGASSVAPGGSPSAVQIPADFPLGSWTSTITKEDLRAGGVTEAGLLQENAGTFTQTFNSDGTWIGAQVSTEAVNLPVFRGTFRVTGAHQFEQTTTFPAEYAGDVVSFTWQLDKKALIMGVPNPPDPMLKVITEAHPWQLK